MFTNIHIGLAQAPHSLVSFPNKEVYICSRVLASIHVLLAAAVARG